MNEDKSAIRFVLILGIFFSAIALVQYFEITKLGEDVSDVRHELRIQKKTLQTQSEGSQDIWNEFYWNAEIEWECIETEDTKFLNLTATYMFTTKWNISKIVPFDEKISANPSIHFDPWAYIRKEGYTEAHSLEHIWVEKINVAKCTKYRLVKREKRKD